MHSSVPAVCADDNFFLTCDINVPIAPIRYLDDFFTADSYNIHKDVF